MKAAKQQAIDSISRLPPDATWHDIIYSLRVVQKIAKGIDAAEKGRIISHKEVKRVFVR